jgi:hypothetical protein
MARINGNNDPVLSGGRLFYYPILHAQADLGSLGVSVQRAAVRKLGKLAWNRNVQLVDQLWLRIEREIETLALPCERMRLYQDGLADCGREKEIVAEMAKTGSPNHRLLLRLIERGAVVMGAESPELLIKECQLAKQSIAALRLPQRRNESQEKLRRTLLRQRDAYIAQRINDTLRGGEIGILFLGMLHSLENRLDPDIQVIYPDWWPSASRRNHP